MLITLILTFLLAVVNVIPNLIISIFPALDIHTLPLGIDAILVQGIGYLNFIKAIFPPLAVMWEALMFVIYFKLGLKVIAMIPFIRGILHRT